MSYKVKLDIFEGPFDLLVYLIETAEMSIYDIRIAEITEKYLDALREMEKQDVAVTGDFMVLAATLIEIKSRMLLPNASPDGEEAEDPRSELVQKLLEYKKAKAEAALLAEQEDYARRIYKKPQEDLSVYTKEPDEILNLDLPAFVKAFELFLQKKKRIEEMHTRYVRVERERMTLEARIEQIKSYFREGRSVKFLDLLGGKKTRSNAVLTFLSILELVRQKTLTARQRSNFGEITLTPAKEKK